MPEKLISSDNARTSKKQHTKPCSDCPWSRNSLNGWLGGYSAEAWIAEVKSDDKIQCHVFKNQQCAGSAIYRANVCKSPRNPEVLKLPKNTNIVFSFGEFEKHHNRKQNGSH